jgi:hypothetical protein
MEYNFDKTNNQKKIDNLFLCQIINILDTYLYFIISYYGKIIIIRWVEWKIELRNIVFFL